ncbi:MAG TPA: cupin domain-containing protein, partial [Chloroflexota bacterium]|nr:cupin domain-containing protein [Chloroflexota bacterium]
QGVPIIEGFGVEDVKTVPLAPWPRVGGKGAFVQLYGMEGVTGMYLVEIPAGGSLEPEKHLYEEELVVLKGNGLTEVWQDGGRKQLFEWGEGSVFAPPGNTWHRLINGTNEPARLMGVTTAPLLMDLLHNTDFIFNCEHQFPERFSGEDGYFAAGDKRYQSGRFHSNLWETNFIPDVRQASIDAHEVKGSGVHITVFEMAGNSLIGHMSEWPEGRYHKAHYHGPGAILYILSSEGYVLIWPKDAGVRPYENGRGEDVVEFHWKPGSIYCPPSGWFHQHLNTGPEPARQLALRFGSRHHPVEFELAMRRQEEGVLCSIREGGTLIEYDDEDPEIRRRFEAALKAKGIESQMPAVTYRTDHVTV